jgi:dihydropyrimidinase
VVLVAGGTAWAPEGARRADVLVEGGRIAAIGDLSGWRGVAEVIDASGLDVLPGLIDLHVHVADRIGRFELADDFASGTEVAVCSGITTIFTFATQRPGETLAESVARYVSRAEGRCHCNVGFHLTPTVRPWDWDAIEAQVAAGRRTFKLYTTYREAGLYTDWREIEEVMWVLAGLGARLLLHCEDDDVLATVDPGALDVSKPLTHTLLRPETAEVEAVRCAVELAERTGCPLHVVHASTARAVEVIAEARRRAPVTCETGPQYLLLDERRLRGRWAHRALCTPPLRSEATRAELETLLGAGAIDVLATDHCAFRRADKDDWRSDYRAVPCGLPGLGALVPLAHELLVSRLGLPLHELALRLAANPARVLGLYPRKGALIVGADADLVVLDTATPRRPVVSTLSDAYDPWSDRRTTVKARHVLLGGNPVVRDGALVERERVRGVVFSAA